MTEEEKKLLSTFETQLRHLMYLHDELKRENAGLRKLLENEKLKNEKVQAQYDELEVNYTNLKTATTVSYTHLLQNKEVTKSARTKR